MRSLLLGAAALAFCASPAFAADDVMANYYGNTVVATGGMVDTHTYYSPDHTLITKAPAFGLQYKGVWKLDGANVCRTYDAPPAGVPNPSCAPVVAHKIGDSWTVTVGDKTRTLTLLKGIQ
ncbi:MAG TPA: hypothetical protein VN932_12270 [Rhizomicrobium sp.]|nr:hypothetical protein [Rhizomicrobium sp.]